MSDTENRNDVMTRIPPWALGLGQKQWVCSQDEGCPYPGPPVLPVDDWSYEDMAEKGNPLCVCGEDMELVPR